MILNSKTTKCLPFNNSLTKDLVPQLTVEPGKNFEVIYKMRLVGLVRLLTNRGPDRSASCLI